MTWFSLSISAQQIPGQAKHTLPLGTILLKHVLTRALSDYAKDHQVNRLARIVCLSDLQNLQNIRLVNDEQWKHPTKTNSFKLKIILFERTLWSLNSWCLPAMCLWGKDMTLFFHGRSINKGPFIKTTYLPTVNQVFGNLYHIFWMLNNTKHLKEILLEVFNQSFPILSSLALAALQHAMSLPSNKTLTHHWLSNYLDPCFLQIPSSFTCFPRFPNMQSKEHV